MCRDVVENSGAGKVQNLRLGCETSGYHPRVREGQLGGKRDKKGGGRAREGGKHGVA